MREHSFQATPAELQSLGDRLQRFCQLTHVQRHLMLEYAKGFAEAHSSQKLAYDCFYWMVRTFNPLLEQTCLKFWLFQHVMRHAR